MVRRVRQLVPRSNEVRDLLHLAVPVIVVQVGMMAMGVADTVMVGHVSSIALAAVALGNLYFFGAAVFGMGFLMALDSVVAQAVGAGDHEAVARAVQRGLLLAMALCLPGALLLLPAEAVLSLLHQPAEIVPTAGAFARISTPGLPGFLVFVVLRQSLQALNRMRPIVVTIVVANLANIGLNWVLIYGHLGFPAMGAIGSAWATVLSRTLMALLLLALGWGDLRALIRPLRPAVFALAPLGRMIRLGTPIGVQYQLEYGVFGIVGLLMGVVGPTAMAAHQVALNIASFTFMVPLGLSAAVAVLVGQAVGRDDPLAARRAARAAIVCGMGFMSCTAVALVTLPRFFAGLYTSAGDVIAIAVVLLPLAGVFQVFDGLQVVSIGILRGVGDTRTPMIVNVLGFWLLGLPVSYYLGIHAGWGPAGLWWGLVLGLIAVGVFLLVRVRARLTGTLARIVIDERLAIPE
jgi:MATE family multidrug resistance protein